MMQITWFGHAAFLLESDGLRIITDPYHPSCGFGPVDATADIVSLSHDNPKYHSCMEHIHGDYLPVHGLEVAADGPTTVRGVPFSAIEVYEDEQQTGPNAMVKFTIEGITFGHMGDLGHQLHGDQREFLRDVDVLLALAGAGPTIALPDLRELVGDLAPPITIPMHYQAAGLDLGLHPVEDFLALCPPDWVKQIPSATVSVTKDTLPDGPEVWVLEHAR